LAVVDGEFSALKHLSAELRSEDVARGPIGLLAEQDSTDFSSFWKVENLEEISSPSTI
jgi:hypothetical protein